MPQSFTRVQRRPAASREPRRPIRHVPRLPHPSWARPFEPTERIAVSAADFWNRLGL